MINEPIIEFITALPTHDRETLLHILEVAKGALVLDYRERELYNGLCLSIWKSVKLEELP